jgi:hypothetical protein
VGVAFNVNYLMGIILFLVVPSVYLSVRYPQHVKSATISTVLFALPMAVVVDYIAHYTGTWYVTDSLADPYRILGLVPIEDILWVMYAYFVVIYYEVFIDRHLFEDVSYKNMKYLAYIVFTLLGLFFLALSYAPSILSIPFFYIKLVVVFAIIPIVLAYYKAPSLVVKMSKSILFFAVSFFSYELTALYLGHWSFPNNEFIGTMSIGSFVFPLEEPLLWGALLPVAILTYFEFFEDDRK